MLPRAAPLLVALALPLAFEPTARADPPASAQTVYAVEVHPGESGIDAAAVRSAVARELDAVAVNQDDPRALHALGTLVVTIDLPGRALAVTYREGSAPPVARSIALPEGDAAIVRAAAFLAGNLARDEARELAEALRGARGATDGAGEALAPAVDRGAPLPETDPEEANLNHLHRVLEEHAHRESVLRVAWWVTEGTSLAVMAAGLAAELDHQSYWGGLLIGGYAVSYGCLVLPYPGGFGDLLDHYATERAQESSAELVRLDVEQEWRRWAQREHRRRRTGGWVGLGLGVALTTVDTWALLTLRGPTGAFEPSFTAFGIAGVEMIAAGIDRLVSDGVVESALRDYEASSRPPAAPAGLTGLGLQLIPLRGGGALGLGARF